MAKITRTITKHEISVMTNHGEVRIGRFDKTPVMSVIQHRFALNTDGEEWGQSNYVIDRPKTMKYSMDLDKFIQNAELEADVEEVAE